MNIKEKLNKIEKELAEVKQELNKTEEEWIPKYEEEYWYYDKTTERIGESYWAGCNTDNIRLKNRVIFKTKEEAERYADYQKAKEEYSYEFSNEEWEDINSGKYYIFYNYYENKLDIALNMCAKLLNSLYFKTGQQAQEFIDKYQAEILEFEFGIKE